jgi:hypothetical protein
LFNAESTITLKIAIQENDVLTKGKIVISFLPSLLDNKILSYLLFLLFRSSGRSMLHKRAKVEFYPLGVIGAIVSWNYPFHNVLNPMLAAVFSGNAAVIKVIQHNLAQ